MKPGDEVQLVLKGVKVLKISEDDVVTFGVKNGSRIEIARDELHELQRFGVVTHHRYDLEAVVW